MRYSAKDHTFVICAYKESEYLEQCIRSLLKQNEKGQIIMATSTPNSHIEALARKYKLELYINHEAPGIASDWNFALKQVKTPLATIAHQDDIYDKDYVEHVLTALNKTKNPILTHSAYYEIRDGKKVYSNKLLRIKKLMLMPLIPSFTWNSKFLRRRSLSLGCAICCPSVTYVLDRFPEDPFEVGCKADLDWQAWEKYSKEKGAFCYIKKPIMGHRVHQESETSNVIGDGGGRTGEDYEMYRKFWPKFIADILIKFYAKGQDSNSL